MVNFKLARGPTSLTGVAAPPAETEGAYVNKKTLRSLAGAETLRVVPSEKIAGASGGDVALLHPESSLLAPNAAHSLLALEAGSDCVLRAVAHEEVPPGCLALSHEQRYNVHVAEDQSASFAPFAPKDGEASTLVDVVLEVRLLRGDGRGAPERDDGAASSSDDSSDDSSSTDDDSSSASSSSSVLPAVSRSDPERDPPTIDGAALSAQLAARLANRWVSVGELFTAQSACGRRLRVRVARCDTESFGGSLPRVGYHCFRGVVVSGETDVHVRAEGTADPTSDGVTVGGGVRVSGSSPGGGSGGRNIARTNAAPDDSVVEVLTSDGESFPVRRELVRPCISLTRGLRGKAPGGDAPFDSVSVGEASPSPSSSSSSVLAPVDSAAFDRVLVWLEAEALGAPLPEHDIRTTEALAEAASRLGLRSLSDHCSARMGAHRARAKRRSWAEVLRHNELGGVWLVVDGMILDVKRWLPEHPGGDRIIPAQSLNAEAARHFELYHSSRESFLYLKHFYVGEVRAEDVGKMPLVPGPPASEDFKRQLREYTEDFRISSEASPEDDDDEGDEGEGGKVHVHLGAKAR